jgi:opacity protein-like surface antigen
MAKRTIGKRGNFEKKAAAITLTGFLGAASPTYALPVNSEPAPEKNKSKVSITLEANKGSGSYGAGLGLKVGKIGFGVKGKKYSNRNLYDIKENIPGFEGISFQGRKDFEKTTYMGIFAEVYPRILENLSLVLGASGGIKKGTINIEEKLLRGEDELASHETSALKKGFGWDVYAGLIYDFTGNISAGPFVGYGSSKENELGKEGVSFGIKANFKLK